MSAEEIAKAKCLVAQLRLPDDKVATRRFRADPHGKRIDPRKTFRRSLRAGGASIELAFRAKALRHPPLVALVDISGSMAEYSRLFLHFLTPWRKNAAGCIASSSRRGYHISRELTSRDPTRR
jgi:uncharacterized protein with von Willebrand factor type A (vWA) domain